MFSQRGLKRKASDVPMLSSPSKKKFSPAERALLEAEVALAQQIIPRNPVIRSGAPSGLFNLSVNSKENKFVDVSLGIGTATGYSNIMTTTSAPQMYLLNGLKLGTGAYNRIGNKIAMKSLYWSLAFGLRVTDSDPSADTEIYNVPVRFMIVYDKQTNGAAFNPLTDLLSAFSGVDNSTARKIDVNSPNNLNNRDRFIVIADKRFMLQSGGPSTKFIKKFKRLNTSVAYKSGATVGDVTDITSGSLYAFAYRDENMSLVVSDGFDLVYMSGDIRLRFSDE